MTGVARRLSAIAVNTFREAVRDRVLYSILFFAGAVILASLALQEVTIGDQAKVVRSMGQGAIDLFGSIIAMFLGVSLVYKELEQKTIKLLGDDDSVSSEQVANALMQLRKIVLGNAAPEDAQGDPHVPPNP